MNLGSTTRWYYRLSFVLLMLFVVMGPFALPLLWKSPEFKRPVKMLLTVLVLIFTAWILGKVWVEGKKILDQFRANALS